MWTILHYTTFVLLLNIPVAEQHPSQTTIEKLFKFSESCSFFEMTKFLKGFFREDKKIPEKCFKNSYNTVEQMIKFEMPLIFFESYLLVMSYYKLTYRNLVNREKLITLL